MAEGYSTGDWAKGCRMAGWLKRGYPWIDCRIEVFGFAFLVLFAADEAGLLFRVSEQSYLDVADVSMVFLVSQSSSQPERGLEGR